MLITYGKVQLATTYGAIHQFVIVPTVVIARNTRNGDVAVTLLWLFWRVSFERECS